jgi:hypothetical protein
MALPRPFFAPSRLRANHPSPVVPDLTGDPAYLPHRCRSKLDPGSNPGCRAGLAAFRRLTLDITNHIGYKPRRDGCGWRVRIASPPPCGPQRRPVGRRSPKRKRPRSTHMGRAGDLRPRTGRYAASVWQQGREPALPQPHGERAEPARSARRTPAVRSSVGTPSLSGPGTPRAPACPSAPLPLRRYPGLASGRCCMTPAHA